MTTSTPQHFSDHLEIQQVLQLYASALDKKQWVALDNVFTEDAVADFIGLGSFAGRQNITDFVKAVLVQCSVTQHLLGNINVVVNGDEAHTTCYLSALHVGLGDYATQTLTVWGEYSDKLVRTANGWRIDHRTLTTMHASGDVGLK